MSREEDELVRRFTASDRIQKNLGFSLQKGGCKKNGNWAKAERMFDQIVIDRYMKKMGV